MSEQNRRTLPFLAGAVDAVEGRQDLAIPDWESLNELLVSRQSTAQWLDAIQHWSSLGGSLSAGQFQSTAVWLLPDITIWHSLNNGQFQHFLKLIIDCYVYRAFGRINALLLLQLLIRDSQESVFSGSLQYLLENTPETAQAVLTNLDSIGDSSAQSLEYFYQLVRSTTLEKLLKSLHGSGYVALKRTLLKWLIQKSQEKQSLEAAQLTIHWLNHLAQHNPESLVTLNQLPEEQILQALQTHNIPAHTHSGHSFVVNGPGGDVAVMELTVGLEGIVIDDGSDDEQLPSLDSGLGMEEIEEALAEALQENVENPPTATILHSPFAAEVEGFQLIDPADCW